MMTTPKGTMPTAITQVASTTMPSTMITSATAEVSRLTVRARGTAARCPAVHAASLSFVALVRIPTDPSRGRSPRPAAFVTEETTTATTTAMIAGKATAARLSPMVDNYTAIPSTSEPLGRVGRSQPTG